MIVLSLNLDQNEVLVLRRGELICGYPRKWAELYALLEHARREGRPTVGVDRLSELEGWSSQPESVGKMMSRHLLELKKERPDSD